ncbi:MULTISPECIES: hypothetical protein [Rhizobium/Agrobacterium group]|uniref:hypothetical protein n=1 Tax=Rhizobium/Agrobacterium group TaxID=227290 RepID=UPI000B3FAFBB|nr:MULTISPECIES: hypothetical protein [Rhizobium/Agrobacterium group]MCF1485578.1 hypothetical protein [Allorhizobium ampelinum]NSZ46269.1 hypothetical protein [Agrobacterium vitis]NTA25365.1 hypothetical protein [Allorhizobium ampelinum]OVE97155.1 hypothetical protein B7W85_02495 [Allorhizobium ampelinum]
MLVRSKTEQKPIGLYHYCNTLLRSFTGQESVLESFSTREIDRLILTGTDYVLSGTSIESEGILSLHRWFSEQQKFALNEVRDAIAGKYPAAVGQSLAWGLHDRSALLNGYKTDVDILLERKNANALFADLEVRGHRKRVIDAETGDLIEVDKDYGCIPDKSFVGSIYIPFSLSQFDNRTQHHIKRLAGHHQPFNIPKKGDPYILLGVDAIHAYGGVAIDMLSCSVPDDALRLQKPEHNLEATLVRLRFFLQQGHLKPNLLLIIARMVSRVDPQDMVERMRKRALLPFLKSYIAYHEDFISQEALREYEILTKETEFDGTIDFSEVYDSFETFLVSYEY